MTDDGTSPATGGPSGITAEDGALAFSPVLGTVFNSAFGMLVPGVSSGILVGIAIGALGKSLIGLNSYKSGKGYGHLSEDLFLFFATFLGLIIAGYYEKSSYLEAALAIGFVLKAAPSLYYERRKSGKPAGLLASRFEDLVLVVIGLSVLCIGYPFLALSSVTMGVVNMLLFLAALAKAFPSIVSNGNPAAPSSAVKHPPGN